jgi:hypothetical protein
MSVTVEGCRASLCQPSRMSAAHSQHIPRSRDFASGASLCWCHKRGRRSPQANDVPPNNTNTRLHRKSGRRTPGGTSVCLFSICLACMEQYRNITDYKAWKDNIMCCRIKGDKPLYIIFETELWDAKAPSMKLYGACKKSAKPALLLSDRAGREWQVALAL